MDKKKIVEIANLELDCKIGKDRHFVAADRKNKLRIALGLFAVVGSAVISSGIGSSTQELISKYMLADKHWQEWSKVLGHILPLLVGICTAVIGFLGLEKQTAQHRFVGNAYIEISRKARSILNSINESNYNAKIEAYEELVEKYLEINKEGESCPTNNKDNSKAMSMNSKKRSAIKAKISDFDRIEFDIKDKPEIKKASLTKLLTKGLKMRTACVLARIGIIRNSDYRKYLQSQ